MPSPPVARTFALGLIHPLVRGAGVGVAVKVAVGVKVAVLVGVLLGVLDGVGVEATPATMKLKSSQ